MQPKDVSRIRGSVASWIVTSRPPEVLLVGSSMYAVWIPVRVGAFAVGPTPKSNGALSVQQLDELVQRARDGGYPDVIIGDYRVIAVGDAWQRLNLVGALRQLLAHNGLDQLALVDQRPSWFDRLWAVLAGRAPSIPH